MVRHLARDDAQTFINVVDEVGLFTFKGWLFLIQTSALSIRHWTFLNHRSARTACIIFIESVATKPFSQDH